MDLKNIFRVLIGIFLIFGVVIGVGFSELTGALLSNVSKTSSTSNENFHIVIKGNSNFEVKSYDTKKKAREKLLEGGKIFDDKKEAEVSSALGVINPTEKALKNIPAQRKLAILNNPKYSQTLISLISGKKESSWYDFFTPTIDGSLIGTQLVSEAVSEVKASCNSCDVNSYNQKLKENLNAKLNFLCNEEKCSCTIGSCDTTKLTSKAQVAYESAKEQFNKKQQVTTNIGYDIISILANPDQNALKASKLFGFEDSFNFRDTSLYQMFGEPFPSKICLAKIDGYLDDTKSQGGGITNYKFNSTSKSIEVMYDLRAQRTKMTPNKKSMISYSYFVRAQSDDLKFIIAISFIGDGVVKKIALTDMKSVSSGSKDNGFESLEVPLNVSRVDENSFQIGLIAVDSSNSPVYSITAPIVLITSGDGNYGIDSSSGNSNGNSQALSQSNSPTFGINDMLGMMNS